MTYAFVLYMENTNDTLPFFRRGYPMKLMPCQLITFACFSLQLNYKVEGEKMKHKYTMDPELPQFIQAKVNAINMSDVSIWPGNA